MVLKHELDAIEKMVRGSTPQLLGTETASDTSLNRLVGNMKSILGNTHGSNGAVSPLEASLAATEIICKIKDTNPKVADGISYQMACIAADTKNADAVYYASKELSKYVGDLNMAIKCAAKLASYASSQKTRANLPEYVTSAQYSLSLLKR